MARKTNEVAIPRKRSDQGELVIHSARAKNTNARMTDKTVNQWRIWVELLGCESVSATSEL
jgi:hypothetical protein